MVCATDAQCNDRAGSVPAVGRSPLPGAAGIGPRWPIPTPGLDDPGGPGLPAATPRPRPESLNARDRELLRHLAAGASTAQVAAVLAVSTNTARTRIRRICGKLDVTGRYEVVRAARALGVV